MPYILAHEEAHIRRLDHLVKPLFFLAMAIHWFNPLVWLAFRLLSRDMEIACDAQVIKQMGEQAKKEYGRLFFSFATERPRFSASLLGFGESSASQRIKSILTYKQPTAIVIAIAILLCAATAIAAATISYDKEKTADAMLTELLQDPTVTASIGNTESRFYGQEEIASQFMEAFGDTRGWEEISEEGMSGDNRFSKRISHDELCTFIDNQTRNKQMNLTSYESGTLISFLDHSQYEIRRYFTEEDIYTDIAALLLKYDDEALREIFAKDSHMVAVGDFYYPIDTTALDLGPMDLGDCTVLTQFQQLQTLALTNVTIADTAKLGTMTQLKGLTISGNNISELSFLKNLENLTSLSLHFMNIADISPLAEAKQLEYLSLSNMPVTDISPLQGLGKLTDLNLQFTDVADLTPLQGLTALTALDLEVTPVSDVEALAGLTQLRELHLTNTKVRDISPLQALQSLNWLDLQATDVEDISAVSSLTNLKTLTLLGTKVSDLSPLTGLENMLYLGLPTAFQDQEVIGELQQKWSGRADYADATIDFFDIQYQNKKDITAW